MASAGGAFVRRQATGQQPGVEVAGDGQDATLARVRAYNLSAQATLALLWAKLQDFENALIASGLGAQSADQLRELGHEIQRDGMRAGRQILAAAKAVEALMHEYQHEEDLGTR